MKGDGEGTHVEPSKISAILAMGDLDWQFDCSICSETWRWCLHDCASKSRRFLEVASAVTTQVECAGVDSRLDTAPGWDSLRPGNPLGYSPLLARLGFGLVGCRHSLRSPNPAYRAMPPPQPKQKSPHRTSKTGAVSLVQRGLVSG